MAVSATNGHGTSRKQRKRQVVDMEVTLPRPPKPRFRGSLHRAAFFVSIPAGAGLIAFAQGAAAKVAAIIFAVSLTGLYGVSAMYHRGHWSERAERMMQHLDHSMIYVLIAGTYTPVTLLALRPALGITVLALAWTAAVCGIVMRFLRSPRWRPFGFALYLVMGWLIVVAVPQLFGALDRPELALLFVGGVLYTTGAIVLARNSPNPRPLTFGYHEIWHTMVVAAGACHFMLVVLLVRA